MLGLDLIATHDGVRTQGFCLDRINMGGHKNNRREAGTARQIPQLVETATVT
jgi:hypothetical protein